MQRAYHAIKAKHRTLLERVFSTFAPDFTPDESNELMRGIVKRAKEVGLSERHAILGDDARLTYLCCRSEDGRSGMSVRYIPPDHKIWDDPTYGAEPAQITVQIYSRTAQTEEFNYLSAFVYRMA